MAELIKFRQIMSIRGITLPDPNQSTQGFRENIFLQAQIIVLTTTIQSVTNVFLSYIFELFKFNIGKPQLATEIRYNRGVFSFLNPKKGEKSIKKNPYFNADVTRQISDFSEGAKNTKKNEGFFQNMLLFGPPGTGKTMVVRKIAEESDMDYVMMSGGDLAQFIKRGEHVTELNKLIQSAKSASNPTIIFIDEIESLARKRDKIERSEHFELFNAFLKETGEPSKKIILIGATNRPQDLDEAVLDRFDKKIQIDLPEKSERVQIIKDLANQFFTEPELQEHFTDAKVEKMANKTKGFSGRILFKTMNDMYVKKSASTDNQLTDRIIDVSIADMSKSKI